MRREAGRRAAAGLAVLIVEQNRALGELLAGALEQEGCRATLVTSADQALERARHERFDLVALDVAQPAHLDPQLIASLAARMPVVAMAARTRDLAPQLSGDRHRLVRKPFYVSEVVTAVLQSLGRTPN